MVNVEAIWQLVWHVTSGTLGRRRVRQLDVRTCTNRCCEAKQACQHPLGGKCHNDRIEGGEACPSPHLCGRDL